VGEDGHCRWRGAVLVGTQVDSRIELSLDSRNPDYSPSSGVELRRLAARDSLPMHTWDLGCSSHFLNWRLLTIKVRHELVICIV
jgi:hypothetical protein